MNRAILLVDDEKEIRELLSDFLQDLGETVGVSNGIEALEALKQRHFDLVISDYTMPGMNGLELLKQMNAAGSRTPLIWITGRSTRELVVEAWKEGVFDYFEKPFDLEQIRKSVITALSIADSVSGESSGEGSGLWRPELDPALEAALTLKAGTLGLTPNEYLQRIIKQALENKD